VKVFVFYLYVLFCNLDVLLCNDHNLENTLETKPYIWFYRKLLCFFVL
jgi:hypothetical protein